MKNVLIDMLKAQGFTDAQSMEFACEHTLLSKKYEKQVQTCWYGEQTSTLEVKLFVNLEAGVCRVWFHSDGRRDAYKERWYSTPFLSCLLPVFPEKRRKTRSITCQNRRGMAQMKISRQKIGVDAARDLW